MRVRGRHRGDRRLPVRALNDSQTLVSLWRSMSRATRSYSPCLLRPPADTGRGLTWQLASADS